MHSIVEVCRKTKLSSRTLRVWEEEGLLCGQRNAVGMRVFETSVFDTIAKIQMLKELGFSLKQIREYLDNNQDAFIAATIRQQRQEIEQQVAKLSKTHKQLTAFENLAGEQTSVDVFAPRAVLAERYAEVLFQKNPTLDDAVHREYLNNELAFLDADEIVLWLGALQKLKSEASIRKIPTHFVRGFAASSLSLCLLGLTRIDPCAEGLVPHHPLGQDLHFDVPYSGSESFFESLAKINNDYEGCKCVAFKLPLLDVVASFSQKTGLDPYCWESETKLLQYLNDGDLKYVFAFDESNDSLLQRLYPDLSPQQRSLETVAQHLKLFSPRNKMDVLKFFALRTQAARHVFDECVSGKAALKFDGKLSQLAADERGYVFFREDLLSAVKNLTGWSWQEVFAFRNKVRRNELTDADINSFKTLTDKTSLEFFCHWENTAYHKAHLIGWWQHIATTLTCKLRDAKTWERCIKDWEQQHGLQWNDFGVVWREAKLLTPI